MPNPTAAMIVIGDEILAGRTRDSNLHQLAGRLAETGIDLVEARVIADSPGAIVAAVQELSGRHDHVFTSGGIGPTHDDITADCVARALGAAIDVRDDARAILQAHYDATGKELTEARLRMARIPEGAELIGNPVSAAPGFTLRNVHVMAGVPRIFEAMLAGLLPALPGGRPRISDTLRVERPESELAGPLRRLAGEMPDLTFGSYPFEEGSRYGANIVVRGADAATVAAGMERLRALFEDDFAG
ncbi:competence/damage-inducible protein A [Wenxinia saemankumensis]|uniref:Molybdenum cofactor synthesis domain-containing protein n=1 Tax=Wenxinia saemankumensis TaxID=1447782 RepID=A0A1M6EUP8_9RHOB|nr:molybdopterin-binding protein [Wenxinia saemankumensis]SHI89148.1 molybdenum cofactor synthesis domain-containing protein [Wenxinia saemankumensis]